MNKYYTPEIEEFYVGFEYEEKWEDGWHPETFGVHHMINSDILKNEVIRVKYLDREDIESLGFKYSRYSGSYTQYFTKDNIEISIGSADRKDSTLRVKRIWSVSNEIVFKGTIKNKSELKKLLKQLGI